MKCNVCTVVIRAPCGEYMIARVIPIQPMSKVPALQSLAAEDAAEIYSILAEVKDPELPMLSIEDLGVLRSIGRTATGQLCIVITPTYSGCPAMRVIEESIEQALVAAGYEQPLVVEQLFPVWTTDWMSRAGRAALQEHGIAAPLPANCAQPVPEEGLVCPNCGSDATRRLSEFGSTACKAMYRCADCYETFDYFKGF